MLNQEPACMACGECVPAMDARMYSFTPEFLAGSYDRIVAACREQGIARIGLLASVTGKLMASLPELRALRERLEADGLGVWAEVFAVGHPAIEQTYARYGEKADEPMFYDGDEVTSGARALFLPRGWRYARNEFGKPVYNVACPDEVWLQANCKIVRGLAGVFGEIWYDDEFRMDGDMGGGLPHRSTAVCYCERCLLELSGRAGRPVCVADVLASQDLHDLWTQMKTDRLTRAWRALCRAAREARPDVSLGLMVRWGGEERDGLDIGRLLPAFGRRVNLRVGEGHFVRREYGRPHYQAMEYLAATYHAGWFPREVPLLTETTYCDPLPPAWILKKAVLGLAAGAAVIAYCPCVRGHVEYQGFVRDRLSDLRTWSDALRDKLALHRPIHILRSISAARGDKDPLRRSFDRQYFPLFNLAGLCAVVVRRGGWRDDGGTDVVAVTGRTALDVRLRDFGNRTVVVDGHALLEPCPFLDDIGVGGAAPRGGGRVSFTGAYRRDGLLRRRNNIILIPYLWRQVPPRRMPRLLTDMRRVIGAMMRSVVVGGACHVLPVHYRYPERDIILLVNLRHGVSNVELRLPPERGKLKSLDGKDIPLRLRLQADEIRCLAGCRA